MFLNIDVEKNNQISHSIGIFVDCEKERWYRLMTAETVLREIIRCCKKYRVKEAVLFGSRAKGTVAERGIESGIRLKILFRFH